MIELRFVLAEGAQHGSTGLAPALTAVAGVRGVDLHPSTREVWIRGDNLDIEAIKAAIRHAGFRLDDAYPQAVRGPL